MRTLALACCTLIAACAQAPSRPAPRRFRCPAVGGPPWIEVASAHFRLRTDLPPERARAALATFEARVAPTLAFVDRFVPGPPVVAETDLVGMASDEDFSWLFPHSDGFFLATDDRGKPIIIFPAHRVDEEPGIAPHELAHRILRARLPHAPFWFDEGLAMAASPLPRVTAARLQRVPSLDDVVGGSLHAYLADGLALSLAAGALFSTLADGTPAQREGLRAFAADVAAPRPWVDAFVERFGPPSALEPAVRAYLQKLTTMKTTTAPPAALPSDEKFEQRAIDESELHALWAWLAPRLADEQLDAMRAHAGDSPLLYWMLARIAERKRDYVTADADLDRAVALAPSERRWPFERTLMHASRILDGNVPGAQLGPLEGELAVIAQQTDDPRMLNSVAWDYARMHRAALGVPLAERAVAARPDNGDYLDTLALLRYQCGQVAEALRLQQEAAARLSGIGRLSRSILDRLATYEDAAHAR